MIEAVQLGMSYICNRLSEVHKILYGFLCRFLFRVLAVGPLPRHIAFIMDGNRRFSKRRSLKAGDRHRAGYKALESVIERCCDIGIRYVTVYAFSIDNFKRKPEEVQSVMDIILEKSQALIKEDSIVYKYNAKVKYLGDLSLLDEPVRIAAERLMEATSSHTGMLLSICVAYTSTNEIVHAVNGSCREKWARTQQGNVDIVSSEENEIAVADLEKHMHTAGCPDPEILIRTSGENRLSNFLLWQTTSCYLLSLDALWPEISLGHLLWEILEYQRLQPYLARSKSKFSFI